MAKYYHKNNSKDTSGTPGYMAPEVMWSKNHTKAVDYFALGIIGYECMKGERPYLGSRKDIKEKILSKQVQITKNDIPPGWPLEAAHFINSLLQRKPNKRLGFKGVSEIKEHSWLKYYPWRDLYLGKIESPIKPDTAENYDIHYCNKPDRIGHQTYERYIKLIGNSSYPSKFKEFYYFNRDTINERELLNKMFKNPHLLYFEELTGNTKPNDDQPVINRNILKNKVLEEEEEKKEECFQYETTDYQHAIIKKKRINILNSQKGTLFHMYNVFSNGLNTTLLNNNDNATNRISYYHKKKLGKNDLSMNGSYSFRKGHVSFKSNVFY